MTGVTQTILYDPANEVVHGNCLQAAVASVLELPLDAVPHFSQFAWWDAAMELWARGRGLTVRKWLTETIPDERCVLGGQSERGVLHSVVGEGGRIVWDPHPSRAGLVTIKDAFTFDVMTNEGSVCWFCRDPWPTRCEACGSVTA